MELSIASCVSLPISDVAIEARITDAIYFTDSTRANERADFIRPQLLSDGECHLTDLLQVYSARRRSANDRGADGRALKKWRPNGHLCAGNRAS